MGTGGMASTARTGSHTNEVAASLHKTLVEYFLYSAPVFIMILLKMRPEVRIQSLPEFFYILLVDRVQ